MPGAAVVFGALLGGAHDAEDVDDVLLVAGRQPSERKVVHFVSLVERRRVVAIAALGPDAAQVSVERYGHVVRSAEARNEACFGVRGDGGGEVLNGQVRFEDAKRTRLVGVHGACRRKVLEPRDAVGTFRQLGGELRLSCAIAQAESA